MNTKHKLLLIRSLAKNRGFALPMAMIVGLLLLGVGISMIAKSQGDTAKIATQQIKADSLNVAEVGVAQVLELLQNHRQLAWHDSTKDSNRWAEDALTGEKGKVEADFNKKQDWINACPGSPTPDPDSDQQKIAEDLATIRALADYDETTGETSWKPARPNQSNDGIERSYRLVSYDYQGTDGQITGDGTTAILVVEGRARQVSNDEDSEEIKNKSQKQSISRIEVEVEVINERNYNLIVDPTAGAANNPEIPGLWIQKGIINDLKYQGDLNKWLNGRGKHGTLAIDAAKFKSYVLTSERCFEPERKDEAERWANTFISPERDFEATFVEEEFPSPPAESAYNDLKVITIKDNMTLPDEDEVNCDYDVDPPSARCKGRRTERTVQRGEKVTVYEYRVSEINLTGGSSLTIPPEKKVILYVEGDIKTGASGIRHDCPEADSISCKPTDLQIFAYAPKDTTGTICLGDNNPLAAFIFAPNHNLGKSGTGKFTGAMWGKSWGKIATCPSNIDPDFTDSTFVQSALWADLFDDLRPDMPLPSLGRVVKWQQQNIQ